MLKNKAERKLDECKMELLKAEAKGNHLNAARMARYAAEYSFKLGRRWEAMEFLERAGAEFDKTILESEEKGETGRAAATAQEATYSFEILSHIIGNRERMRSFSRAAGDHNMALAGMSVDKWEGAENAMNAAIYYIKAGRYEEALQAGNAAYRGYDGYIDGTRERNGVKACERGMHAVHCLVSIGTETNSMASLIGDAMKLLEKVVDTGIEEMGREISDGEPAAAATLGEKIKDSMWLYIGDEHLERIGKMINLSYMALMR